MGGVRGECYGVYNDTSRQSWGPGVGNSCVHSGIIATSGDLSTVWYNYALASAGTIAEKDTTSSNPAANVSRAAETICPKGWTLPSKAQVDSNKNIAAFSPVAGGDYTNGNIYNVSTQGRWWANEASNGALRVRQMYDGNSLYTSVASRYSGFYIRCVQKS